MMKVSINDLWVMETKNAGIPLDVSANEGPNGDFHYKKATDLVSR
jgi:hypothetical protein